MSSGKQKDFFSSRETAKLLGVAVSTIQMWTNNGLLHAWKTGGGHRRITRNSVEDMLNQQKRASDGHQAAEQFSVVIVEDNERQQRLYKKLFVAWRMDAKIVMARDGFEGLVRIGHMPPDVIISDLKMPNMNGFQLIRVLNELPELVNSLIIVITGLTKIEIKENGGLPPGVHVFTKPVRFDELEKLIRKQIRKRAA